jgi:plasmid segregation protein ParM
MGLEAPTRTDDLRIAVDGRIYNVGNLAIRHSRLAARGLSPTRVEGNNFKVLFLSALSLFCNQPLNSFAVVTGLPPGRMYLSDDLTRQIRGEHRILRMTAQGPEECVIRVDRVTVVPQPLGTYWSQVLDARGKAREESRMLRGSVGIIDIGFRTSDLVSVVDGNYVHEQSRTIPVGLVTAYEEIAAALLASYGVERETYALDEAVIRGEIHIAGKRIDITDLRDRAFSQLSTKLLVELQSSWQVSEFDVILLSGGGSHLLALYLQPHLAQAVVPTDPSTTNGRGFLAWANRNWNPASTAWTEQRPTIA